MAVFSHFFSAIYATQRFSPSSSTARHHLAGQNSFCILQRLPSGWKLLLLLNRLLHNTEFMTLMVGDIIVTKAAR
jgi:hypothetical protein